MATWQSFYQARLSVQVAYQERKVKGDKNAQILLVFDHGNKMKQTHTETHAEVCLLLYMQQSKESKVLQGLVSWWKHDLCQCSEFGSYSEDNDFFDLIHDVIWQLPDLYSHESFPHSL